MVERPIEIITDELYIEPISSCNLKCRLCYANKINGRNAKIMQKEDILAFVGRYEEFYKHDHFTMAWCGTGEILLYKDFTWLVNHINEQFGSRVEHIITTNGTIDRLDEFKSLENITFYISIDGQKAQHDWNRGKGNYEKSVKFCKRAVDLKCKTLWVRTIVTKDNIDHLGEFEDELRQKISPKVSVSLLMPMSSKILAQFSPWSMVARGGVDDSRILTPKETKDLVVKKYGNRFIIEDSFTELGICLNYDGVFACCEGEVKLGEVNADMQTISKNLDRAKGKCKACSAFKFCSEPW